MPESAAANGVAVDGRGGGQAAVAAGCGCCAAHWCRQQGAARARPARAPPQTGLNEGGKLLWIAPSGGRDRRIDPETGAGAGVGRGRDPCAGGWHGSTAGVSGCLRGGAPLHKACPSRLLAAPTHPH